MSLVIPSWKDRLKSNKNKDNNKHSDGSFEFHLPWKSLQLVIPHRLRRRIRSKIQSRISPTSSISALQTSYNPFETLLSLERHHWTILDFQYLILAVIAIFSLCMIETAGPLMKTLISTAIIISLLLPVSRQFFLPFLPTLTWLVFFYACQFIPLSFRLPIWVRLLPNLENVLYGANLSLILSAHKTTLLDLLAWLPYGILHYSLPFIVSILLFIFSPPKTLPVWAKSFGYMNLVAVSIQTLLPCAPPWYEKLYGFAPGSYDIHGNPAGLARIDNLFGVDLYTSSFAQSPVVFGAFPSLHSAHAVLHCLFLCHTFPRLKPFLLAYCAWLWWATMYLEHHYAIDLVFGAIMAISAYHLSKRHFLPRVQRSKLLRWDYEFVEVGEVEEIRGSNDKRKFLVADEYEGYGLTDGGSRPDEHREYGYGFAPESGGGGWGARSFRTFSSGSSTPVVDGEWDDRVESFSLREDREGERRGGSTTVGSSSGSESERSRG